MSVNIDTKALRLALAICNDPSEPRANRDMAESALRNAAPALLSMAERCVEAENDAARADAIALTASKDANELERERDALKAEVERLGTVNDRLMADRRAVLNVKTTDGLTSSEWILRTGLAERDRDAALAKLSTAESEAARLREAKDGAYRERDQLVCALSKVFPSRLERHPDSDKAWDDDWRWIVFVDLPTGQASWHIHDTELEWFSHLSVRSGNSWDGHTTEEKYRRLAALTPAPRAQDTESAEGGKERAK